MDISSTLSAGIGAQQAISQSSLSMTMVKQQNQTQQAIVNMISTSASRGNNLDIHI